MTLKESTAQDTALAAKASPQVPDQGGENDSKKQHSKAFLVLAAMGPRYRNRHGGQRRRRHFNLFHRRREVRLHDAVDHSRHVRSAHRGANYGDAHGRCYRQGLFGADP